MSWSARPRAASESRRRVDIAWIGIRGVMLAVTALAAIGYLDYTYRRPRLTLLVAGGFLAVCLPVLFLLVRRRPTDGSERTVVVGNDPETMADVIAALDGPLLGYGVPSGVDTR